jgi:very-short-patch-repair endonuclease
MKTEFARSLRSNPTDAERKLWRLLRDKQLGGVRSRRQQPIGPYVVDFVCPEARLVVELDGSQHGEEENAKYDEARTAWLESRGYRVVRFVNRDMLKSPETVADAIGNFLRKRPE